MAKIKDSPVTALEGSERSRVRKEVRGFWLNLWRTEGYEVSVSAPIMLRLVDMGDPNSVRELELGPETWLPRGGITAWIVVDGIKLLKRILNYRAGKRVAEIETVSVKVNKGLKRSDLAQRPDLRSVRRRPD